MNKSEKEDLRVKRTRKLLYQALMDLIKKESFETITVKQICDLAMVHRTTFYVHFQDKFDLLTQALRQIADEELHQAGPIDPARNFHEVCEVATKHKELFFQLLLEERDSLRNLLRSEMKMGMMQYADDQIQGWKEMDAMDREIAIEAYIGSALSVLQWWLQNNMPISTEELYRKFERNMNRISSASF